MKNLIKKLIVPQLLLGAVIASFSLTSSADPFDRWRPRPRPGHPRCIPSRVLVDRNGDIRGDSQNPDEYTCNRYERPRPVVMYDYQYNCCSRRVVLSNPKTAWLSREWRGCGPRGAYNWDRWDVTCY